MFDSLHAHGLQHTRLPCPSLSPRVCSQLHPLSRWRYLTVSSSAAIFSFLCSFFPSTGSFSMNRLFTSGGQSIEASASVSVLPMNIQVWFPLGLTYLIALLSKGPSRVFSSTTIWKHQFFSAQPSLGLFITYSVKYLSFSLAFTIVYSLLQYQCSFPFFYTGD